MCVYNKNFTNITNNETVNFTISDKNMNLYELNKKLAVARERVFIFIQINNFRIKIYSILSPISINFYLKLRMPIIHRHLSENYLKIVNIFKHNAMIEEIHFSLRVVNGIYILIHNADSV